MRRNRLLTIMRSGNESYYIASRVGALVNAVPGPPQPVVPCDDVDDDCDGDADERRAPVQCDGIDDDCDGDAERAVRLFNVMALTMTVMVTSEEARPVVHCDNVDDDCDGDVDEAREVVACDDVDDDCDGSIDEGGVGEACDLAELELCEEVGYSVTMAVKLFAKPYNEAESA